MARRRSIRRLHHLLYHDAETMREQARESLAEIRGDVLTRLRSSNRRVADRVRDWLHPVWGLLAFTDEDLLPDQERPRPPTTIRTKHRLPMPVLLELLENPDTSPRVLERSLGDYDWEAYQPRERDRLRTVDNLHVQEAVAKVDG